MRRGKELWVQAWQSRSGFQGVGALLSLPPLAFYITGSNLYSQPRARGYLSAYGTSEARLAQEDKRYRRPQASLL